MLHYYASSDDGDRRSALGLVASNIAKGSSSGVSPEREKSKTSWLADVDDGMLIDGTTAVVVIGREVGRSAWFEGVTILHGPTLDRADVASAPQLGLWASSTNSNCCLSLWRVSISLSSFCDSHSKDFVSCKQESSHNMKKWKIFQLWKLWCFNRCQSENSEDFYFSI